MKIIKQTNRTILFDVINPERFDLINLMAGIEPTGKSLTDEKIKEIHSHLLVHSFDEFLKKFQLSDISELPDYQAVLDKLEELGVFNKSQVQLYRDIEISDEQIDNNYDDTNEKLRLEKLKNIERALDDASIIEDMLNSDEELPDYLDGENYDIIE